MHLDRRTEGERIGLDQKHSNHSSSFDADLHTTNDILIVRNDVAIGCIAQAVV